MRTIVLICLTAGILLAFCWPGEVKIMDDTAAIDPSLGEQSETNAEQPLKQWRRQCSFQTLAGHLADLSRARALQRSLDCAQSALPVQLSELRR